MAIKRAVSLFLTFSLIALFLVIRAPTADALGAVWVKEFSKDKYGDPTEEYYLVNKSWFKGSYNNDSISNGKLGVSLIFKRDDDNLFTYINLYPNMQETEQIKNNAYYDVAVKLIDGNELSMSGKMEAGSIMLRDTFNLADAISASKGDISFYVQESGNNDINYVFKAKSGNFEKLFNQEILIPYKEAQYKKAEQFLLNKQFDMAAFIFSEISDFKDSVARIDEVYEAKNADAYARAEQLLENKQYDEAAKAFCELGDYRDSTSHVSEAYEAKNADAYARAEQLLKNKQYDEAAKAFRELGDYRDSTARVSEAYEAKNADAYARAEQLLENKQYDEAAEAFRELENYRNSSARVTEAYEAKNAELYAQAEKLLDNNEIFQAAEAFRAIGDYRDSATRSDECYIKQFGEKTYDLFNSINEGDPYLFGSYIQNWGADGWGLGDKEDIEWIVLDKNRNENGLSLLLISKYALAGEKYLYYNFDKKSNIPQNIGWQTSDIRKWLNGDFMQNAFSGKEQSMIMTTELTNSDSSNTTKDRVFLLSDQEISQYFSTNKERQCHATSVARGHREDHVYEDWRSGCLWWTRTPSWTSDYIVIVDFDGSFDREHSYDVHVGVRPALWINLATN